MSAQSSDSGIPDPRVTALSKLLQLEKTAREADDSERLGFVMVNDTHRLFDYHQAAFWLLPGSKPELRALSGLAQLEANAPFVRWLEHLLGGLIHEEHAKQIHAIVSTDLPDAEREGFREYTPGFLLYCPLLDANGELFGGLWLTRDKAWNEGEIGLLQLLCESYAHAWQALSNRKRSWSWLSGRRIGRLVWPLLLIGLIAASFIPVRQSVLAPAEVVPAEPWVVAAPLKGVISEILVEPNTRVRSQQTLFLLDDTELRHRHEVSRKALAVAEAEYLRAAQQAFADARSKGEVALLKAKFEKAEAEAAYNAERLAQVRVEAEQDGLVLFSDPNDWIGKPVAVGEKIMTLADPERIELEIELPVADAINLAQGAEVRLFLNTDPTRPRPAELSRASYEAEPTEESVLAFRLRARFSQGEQLRIGLKGTAKIYGNEVPLYYFLFRRPIAVARQWLGL